MKMTKIEDFVKADQAARAEARVVYMEEHDMKSFVKWPQGVTEFRLQPVIPRDHESFGTPKKVFRIALETGEEFDWSINPRSPMYGQIVDKLLEAPVALKLNRMGEGLKTRYSLLEAEE